jgi:hypothetical protein
MLISWNNATLNGGPTTNADLTSGILVAPTPNDTHVMSVFNGTYIEKMQTQHEIDFSDTMKTFYYVDKPTN